MSVQKKLFCLGAPPNSQIFPSLFLSKNAVKIDCEAKSCVLPPAERQRNLNLQLKSFFFFLIQTHQLYHQTAI
jgi:hypothetical protein